MCVECNDTPSVIMFTFSNGEQVEGGKALMVSPSLESATDGPACSGVGARVGGRVSMRSVSTRSESGDVT